MQGGIGHARARILSRRRRRDGRHCATKYRAYIATVMKAAGNADPQGAADADHRPRDQDRPRPRHARGERGLRQGRDGLDPRRAREEGAGHRLGRAARTPRSSAAPRSSRPITPAPIPKLAALVGSEPLDAWKDWLAFHTLNQQANVLPKAVPRRQLRLQRHGACRARRSSGRATSWR